MGAPASPASAGETKAHTWSAAGAAAAPTTPSAAGITATPLASPPAPPRPAPPRPADHSAAPRPSSPTPSARGAGSQARKPINPFLANDPNQKAKRLARALVSDIVAYFPDKHREGLRSGTLKELFREEIKKSYEEYVEQMGKEFSESTTHFQDALNEVLAGGQKLFGGTR